ncbi:hypothetical protein KY304_02015 [Candidatus Woesearchaeota archaeon]|nr:hypothetical protein [Candidatus Woesearchaeota archaeon]
MAVIKHRYTDYDSEFVKIADYLVNFKHVFILEDVYKLMREWFVEEGYTSGSDPDFPEVFFLEKESRAGKEMWIRWRFQKNPLGGKMKEFWRFDFDVDVHVLTLVKVETIIDNKKIKADSGEVEIQVRANLVLDWAKKIKKNSLLKPFRNVVYRYFLHDTRKRLEDELYKNAYGFREALNNFFKIPHFEAKKGGLEFWPKKLPE